jgi:sec-independent protein translocase protein TatA
MLAEIIGPDLLIVFGVLVLLFGGSQLPKLARSIGKAKTEFNKGLAEGHTNQAEKSKTEPSPKADTN